MKCVFKGGVSKKMKAPNVDFGKSSSVVISRIV